MKIKKSLIFLTIILAGMSVYFFKQSKCSNN